MPLNSRLQFPASAPRLIKNNLVSEFPALDSEEISEEAFSQEGDGNHTCRENILCEPRTPPDSPLFAFP